MAIEMADGDPPNINEPPLRALLLIVTKEPPTVKDPSNWSSSFVDFLSKCLQRDPRDRWSAEQLLRHPFISTACDQAKLVSAVEQTKRQLLRQAK
jgi:serine/threonine protein kinase